MNWVSWLRGRWGWAAAGLALGAGCYAAGRWAAPTKTVEVEVERVVTKVETVEVEKVVKVAGPVRVVTKRVEVPGPAGPTVTVERVVERGPTTTTTDTASSGTVAQASEKVVEKIVERDAPRFLLGPTVGAGFSVNGLTPPMYGGIFGVRVGPLYILAQGEGGTVGGSARAGLAFTF